jgi:ABC-2 type transport system ATP-binding protein
MNEYSPNILTVENVSKSFTISRHHSIKERIVNFGRYRNNVDKFDALKDISLQINFGETLGLIGHNGSGKSTLLKIIGGITDADSGSVKRRGRMAALLELGAGFHPDLTGRENIYLNAAILGLSKKDTESVFDDIVDFSGIEPFIDSQVKFYSSGMFVRLAFAVAVHSDPDLVLVDEVLAVGDEPFAKKCMTKIEEFQKDGRSIVLVTHDPLAVKNTCSRVMVLDHGRNVFEGSPKDGLDVLHGIYSEEEKATNGGN